MSVARGTTVAGQVHRLFVEGTVSGLGESQLLERFVARRDEAAFAALVERHGPMVLGVCRRVLGDRHEAEDAFQATFLLLARKAGAIRGRDLVGPWLYRVAYRVALRAGREASRRRARESCDGGAAGAAAAREAARPEPDLPRAIHEELARLPESYRVPVVLCYLEGLTHEQAAARLRWPLGTVKGRLARARDRLRDRLARRGLAMAALVMARTLGRDARAAVAPSLADSTVQAALAVAARRTFAGAASASAVALADGVAVSMNLNKLAGLTSVPLVAFGLFAAGVLAFGAGEGGDRPIADTLTLQAPDPAQVPEHPRSIAGQWKVVRLEYDLGNQRRSLSDLDWDATATDDEITLPSIEGDLDSDWTLAPAKLSYQHRPPNSSKIGEIDLSLPPGDPASPTLPGLYQFRPDGLVICYRVTRGDRPTSFEPDPGEILVVLQSSSATLPAGEPPASAQPSDGPEGDATAMPADPDRDREEVGGLWKLASVERDGRVVLEAKGEGPWTTLILGHDNHFALDPAGPSGGLEWIPRAGTYVQDASRSPRTIDFLVDHVTDGPRRGIYVLSDRTLKVCLRDAGRGPRANGFVTSPGSGLTVLNLERGPTVARDEPATPREGEEEITGVWRVVRHVKSGVAEDPIPPAQQTVIFRTDGYYQNAGGESRVAYTLDRNPTPHRIEFRSPLGGESIRGIYRREEDRLTLCLAESGNPQPFPTEFASPPESGLRLIEMRRVGPAAEGVARPASAPSEGTARPASEESAQATAAAPEPTPGISEETRRALRADLERLRASLDLQRDEVAVARELVRDLRRRLLDLDLEPAGDDPASVEDRSRRKDLLQHAIRRAEDEIEGRLARYQDVMDRIADLEQQQEAPSSEPRKVRPGDVLVIEALEALPGRPLRGERVVRADGTVSLGFYGDLRVAGLDRGQIKVAVIERLRRFLNDEVLGLKVMTDRGEAAVAPADSDRVYVDDSPSAEPDRAGTARVEALERKLDRVLEGLERLRRRPAPGS